MRFYAFILLLFLNCSGVQPDYLTIAIPLGNEGEFLKQQVKRFCDDQNIYNVEFIPLPIELYDYTDEFIDNYLKTSSCADIFPLKNSWTAPLVGMLEILDRFSPGYNIDVHLEPYIRNNIYYDNTLYSKLTALPYSADPTLLYINKSLSQKYGFDTTANFNELEARCLKVIYSEKKIGNSIYGFVFSSGSDGELFETVYDLLQLAEGGTIVNDLYYSTINNNIANNVFEGLLRWQGNISPGRLIENEHNNLIDVIKQKNALYVLAPASLSLSDKVAGFEKYKLSAFGPSAGIGIAARGFSYGVKRGCSRSDDAVRIVYFITSPEQQRLRYDNGFSYPTARDFYNKDNPVKVNEGFDAVREAIVMSEPLISKDLVTNYFYVKEIFTTTLLSCFQNGDCKDIANSFEDQLLLLYNKRF